MNLVEKLDALGLGARELRILTSFGLTRDVKETFGILFVRNNVHFSFMKTKKQRHLFHEKLIFLLLLMLLLHLLRLFLFLHIFSWLLPPSSFCSLVELVTTSLCHLLLSVFAQSLISHEG